MTNTPPVTKQSVNLRFYLYLLHFVCEHWSHKDGSISWSEKNGLNPLLLPDKKLRQFPQWIIKGKRINQDQSIIRWLHLIFDNLFHYKGDVLLRIPTSTYIGISAILLFNIRQSRVHRYINSFEILVTFLENIENEILNCATAIALFFNMFKEDFFCYCTVLDVVIFINIKRLFRVYS